MPTTMLTTDELIKAFVKNYSQYYKDKEVTVYSYTLNEDTLNIAYSYSASEDEKKYGVGDTYDVIEVDLLDYITFAVQYKLTQQIKP
jgi:hypothetical protein